MNTGESRFLVLDAAAGWLAGTPDAAQRVDDLIIYANATGQLPALAHDLFDALGMALGSAPNCRRAAKRLEARAEAAADSLIAEAITAGDYRHLEGGQR